MNTIQTYLYAQKATVQFWNSAITTRRNTKVYGRKIKIYQGVDNPIHFSAKDQDQKPVDLTGYSVQADIQDPIAQLTIISLSVSMVNAAQGLGFLLISSSVANSLANRQYKMTFKVTNIGSAKQFPLYTDHDGLAPIDLMVEDAYYSTSYPGVDQDEIIIDGGTI